MRAPDLLSLVIASGCCLLRVVRAQAGPINITIVPFLAAGADFTITWAGCNSSNSCTVKEFSLLQVNPQGSLAVIQSGEVLPNIVATSIIEQTSTYEVALTYQTSSLEDFSAITVATAPPFIPASATASTTNVLPPASIPNSDSTDTASRHTQTSTGSVLGPVTPLPPPSPTPSNTVSSSAVSPGVSISSVTSTSSDSGGLSTGAKVGIAIGAIGIALIVLIGALLIWRRRRQQQLRALPDGMPYSHDTGSTNRDLMAEKEINVINSPVDTLNNGYSAVPSAPHTQNQPQTGSWSQPDEHSAASGAAAAGAAAVPYSDTHRRSYGSGYADSSSPGPEAQSATPPTAAASGSAIQRKPVGATSGGTTQHLREPGMSDEEVARLEEEERRLDEAIAEAERKRQGQS